MPCNPVQYNLHFHFLLHESYLCFMLAFDLGTPITSLFHCLLPLSGFQPPRARIPLLRLEHDGLWKVQHFASANDPAAVLEFFSPPSFDPSRLYTARIILQSDDESNLPEPHLRFEIRSSNFASPITDSWKVAVLGGYPSYDVLVLQYPVAESSQYRVKMVNFGKEMREPRERELQLPEGLGGRKTRVFSSPSVHLDFHLGILIFEEEAKCYIITYV